MIAVSACLAGIPCRMDGRAKCIPEIETLVKEGKAVPVCPEVLGGLPTPRSPSEIQPSQEMQRNSNFETQSPERRVMNAAGQDVTDAFRFGAQKAYEIFRKNHCTAAVLKAKSPSCGYGQVYDGSFTKTLVPGDGFFGELLRKADVPVFNETNVSELLKNE